MSRSEREKGKSAEREAAEILREGGFEAVRDGRLDTDLRHNVPGFHFEVKRREKLAIPEWVRQATEEAEGRVPVVVYRRNREDWMAVLPFTNLVGLLANQRGAE